MRRETWRLAHARGTPLGVLCLVFGALAERHVAPGIRASVSRQVRWGAVLMPLGFFAGGVLDSEAIPRSVSCWAPWGPGC